MTLVIDTKKPLHKPITCAVDGKVYAANRIDREVINKIDELARKAVKGEPDAAYSQMELLFGKHKALDKLDIREVNDILTYVTTEIFKAEKAEAEEKKAKGPGGKS